MFDNSQMNGVNLRLASLKGASLRSCNLRYAIMAGTDLEVCVCVCVCVCWISLLAYIRSHVYLLVGKIHEVHVIFFAIFTCNAAD